MLLVVRFRDHRARLTGQIGTLLIIFERVDNHELPCTLLTAVVRINISPGYFTSMIRREELKRENVDGF